MRYWFINVLCLLMIGCKSTSHLASDQRLCLAMCNIAEDEIVNSDYVQSKRKVLEYITGLKSMPMMRFPLRVAVLNRMIEDNNAVGDREIRATIDILKKAFSHANITFDIVRIDRIIDDISIEELSENRFAKYRDFSRRHDLKDTITVYFLDYNKKLCQHSHNSIRCGRTGGFSYVLSSFTNNVVLSKFDLLDHKVIVHEFAHFFGLYHTFEDQVFGKDRIDGLDCDKTGDRICDTPADPGLLYEVYVNYSTCDMVDNYDANQDGYYQPLINNYMSYYKPCYLREYSFTPDQLELIEISARSEFRHHLSRP